MGPKHRFRLIQGGEKQDASIIEAILNSSLLPGTEPGTIPLFSLSPNVLLNDTSTVIQALKNKSTTFSDNLRIGVLPVYDMTYDQIDTVIQKILLIQSFGYRIGIDMYRSNSDQDIHKYMIQHPGVHNDFLRISSSQEKGFDDVLRHIIDAITRGFKGSIIISDVDTQNTYDLVVNTWREYLEGIYQKVQMFEKANKDIGARNVPDMSLDSYGSDHIDYIIKRATQNAYGFIYNYLEIAALLRNISLSGKYSGNIELLICQDETLTNINAVFLDLENKYSS